jgi:hypothetical protein
MKPPVELKHLSSADLERITGGWFWGQATPQASCEQLQALKPGVDRMADSWGFHKWEGGSRRRHLNDLMAQKNCPQVQPQTTAPTQ